MRIISRYEVSSLRKGLQILDLLKEKRGLKLADISDHLGINKTTAFRLLYTLEEMNYIIKAGKQYELHPHLFAADHDSDQTLNWSNLRTFYQLGVGVARNIFVGILDGTNIVEHQVYHAGSQQMMYVKKGAAPIHQSALGKVLLANLDLAEQLELTEQLSLTRATGQTFTDPELFLRHLEVIQQQHYATDYEEFLEGMHCIACPIIHDHKVVASFSIADSAGNMPKKTMRSLIPVMVKASHSIAKELYAHPAILT
ncbi:Pectin degradation repressor protein KdgR [compost metagenome]